MYVDVGGDATNFMVVIILVTAVSSGVILLLVVTFIYCYIHKRKSGFTLETNTSYGKIYALKIQKEVIYQGRGGKVGSRLTNILDQQKLSHGNGSHL